MLQRRRRSLLALAVLVLATMAWLLSGGEQDVRTEPAPSTPAEFIEYAALPAQEGMQEFGVPASVSLAQAIVESNWAQSELTVEGLNYFGIKCAGESPYAIGCLERPTQECDENGFCAQTTAKFRTYASAEDSFRDHGHFLTTNPRYEEAFDYADEPDQFAAAIAQAGYATDPGYAAKLIELMKQYDLYKYDDA